MTSLHIPQLLSLPKATIGLTVAIAASLAGGPAWAQSYPNVEPPYSEQELEPIETDINQSVETDEPEASTLPEAFDDINIYSEDEYDIYEGIDAFERRERPDQPDLYDEQPGIYGNEIE